MMAIAALTEIGPEVIMTRPDIVRELRAVAANPGTVPDLKKKTKELLAKLRNSNHGDRARLGAAAVG